jgi:hypothetical protein
MYNMPRNRKGNARIHATLGAIRSLVEAIALRAIPLIRHR